jgi:hypothetical protein
MIGCIMSKNDTAGSEDKPRSSWVCIGEIKNRFTVKQTPRKRWNPITSAGIKE